MKITIEIPPDMEKLLLEKCREKNVSPAEFVYLLLEWYFYRRQKSSGELAEFLKVAKQIAEERVKYCKYSDGVYCALEALEDVLSEKEPAPITPYRCLFCVYFVDRRRERPKIDLKGMEIYDVAKLAAKLVVELYGDKLGYKPKVKAEEVVEDERSKVEKLLDW